jgi:hypothetical protein
MSPGVNHLTNHLLAAPPTLPPHIFNVVAVQHDRHTVKSSGEPPGEKPLNPKIMI